MDGSTWQGLSSVLQFEPDFISFHFAVFLVIQDFALACAESDSQKLFSDRVEKQASTMDITLGKHFSNCWTTHFQLLLMPSAAAL